MSNITDSIKEINKMQELTNQNSWLSKRHPIAKLFVTIGFIAITVSFSKYDLSHLILMSVYIIISFYLGEISIINAIKKTAFVYPLLIFVGIFNPFFDKIPVASIATSFGVLTITSGMISFTTLFIKGILALFATYGFMTTVSLDDFCYSLKQLHLPDILVTQIMLTCRYINLILNQANEMWQAYSLRAPKHKGVHFTAWGSFIGSLLLRSISRAENVYDSMLLRGFSGKLVTLYNRKFLLKDFLYIVIWLFIFLFIRFIYG